ncbi:MAG: HD domain-containing protein [Haloferacaceae archaeon]
MTREAEVREAFPAVDRIEDDALHEGVIGAWTVALEDTGWTLSDVPWFPPLQDPAGLDDERLVPHVNEVVATAEAMADALVERRGDRLSLSRDLLLAGALVHDVSKLYEFDASGATAVFDLFGHPLYGIYPAARAGLPPEVVQVVVSHTPRTGVEPATMEAELVCRADQAAAAAVRSRGVDDLRDPV